MERAGAWLLLACKARICLASGLDMETLEEGKNASQIWGHLMRRRSCGWGKYGRAGVGVMQAARRRRLMPGRSRRSKIATGAQLACLNVRLLWRCTLEARSEQVLLTTAPRLGSLHYGSHLRHRVSRPFFCPQEAQEHIAHGEDVYIPAACCRLDTSSRPPDSACRDEVRCGGSKQKPTQNRHGHQKIVFFKIR